MLIGEKKIARPLRQGMIGGGRTANVGPKHRRGALYDNTAFKLVYVDFDVNLGVDLHNILVSYTGCYAINGCAAHVKFLRQLPAFQTNRVFTNVNHFFCSKLRVMTLSASIDFD